MKIFSKITAAVLACVMTAVLFTACNDSEKEAIGTVNGVVMSDGLFLNNFATEIYEESESGDSDIDFQLEGEALYNEVKNKQKDGKSYYDIFIDNALEESRRFMVQYQIFSSREDWPSESDISGLKDSAESYIEQMLSYAGASLGATTVQEMAQLGYGMTYDDLIDYFTVSSTLAQYKTKLQEKISPTDDELKAFFEEHEDEYKSVEVRHSLLSTEDMDDDEKKEVYEHAQELVAQYNDGEITFDDIMKETADVDSSGNPNSDGYYEVEADSNYVTEFRDWALSRTEPSDKAEIVETTFGYHIMICTKINGLEDDDVKENVESAYKMETVDKQADAEIEEYLNKDEYKLKDVNRDYIDNIAKRTFTGDFSDVEESSSAPAATPTAKPEYNDADADDTAIAVFDGKPVLKAYYVQFFSQAMNEALADYDFSDVGDSEEEFYKALNEIVYKEYKDGQTYLDYAKERGSELLTDFLTAKKMAEDAGKTLSDDERSSLLSELDSQIDTMLQYYGTSYGVSTRDELIETMLNVNVNDYKNIYLDQTMVSDYANELIDGMKFEESELDAYLNEHKDEYRAVTVRRIAKMLVDEDGEDISDESKADLLALLELLKEKYENGDSSEALALGYSESTDAGSAKGLVDIRKTSYGIPPEVIDWAFRQTETGASSIIKTESSYEFIIIEGFTDSSKSDGLVANSDSTSSKSLRTELEDAYKSQLFEDSVEKYISDNSLSLTDINDDVVNSVIEDYLTYDPKTVTE